MRSVVSLAAVTTGIVLIAQLAVAQPAHFVAPLSGDAEVPPVDTRARGEAGFHVDPAVTELSFRLLVANIEGVTQAHIHCGGPDQNGPVALFLFGFEPDGVDVNGVLSSGGITSAEVIPLPDSPECPGGVADLADLVEKMAGGGAYVNVHTVANPSGEIRGQIHGGRRR